MLNEFKDFLIRNYIPYQNAKIAKTYGNQPVPIAYWLNKRNRLRKYSPKKKDILIASKRVLKSRGENIPVKELKELLRGRLLGDWALDKGTVVLLWEQLIEEKPKVIIESGSGTSTLINAFYMHTYYPEGLIISLEQQEAEKERIDKQLEKAGLSRYVHILYAPLDEKDHYQVSLQEIETILGPKKADWLVIDGPSGNEGCRKAVMEMMLPCMKSGSRWFTDDAFRDGELTFLQEWQLSDNLLVEGIYPVGKGLATGTVR